MVRSLQRSWQTRRERAHLVRYEDIVLRPVETMTAIFEYLELDASPRTVEFVLAHGSEEVLSLPGSSYEPTELASHRTFSDATATIGRWNREVNGPLVSVADEVFGEALTEFGYG
jgi:hypothetical protein